MLAYSPEHYGREAAERYGLLVASAIDVVSQDPRLLGSRAVAQRPGLLVYPIAQSRSHMPKGSRVRRPVHQIAYSVAEDGHVDILAVVGTNNPAANIIGERRGWLTGVDSASVTLGRYVAATDQAIDRPIKQMRRAVEQGLLPVAGDERNGLMTAHLL